MKSLILLLFIFSSVGFAQTSQSPAPGIKSLSSVTETRIFLDGSSTQNVVQVMEVLTPEAASKASNYTITLPSTDVQFHMLKSFVTDGRHRYFVHPKDVQKSTLVKGGASLIKRPVYSISLKRIHVGSQITIHYALHFKPLMPGIFEAVGAELNNAFADQEVTAYVSSKPMLYFKKNFGDYYTLTSSRQGKLYRIEVLPTEKARLSVGSKLHLGIFGVTTASSWVQVDHALAPKYEKVLRQKLPPNLSKIVAQIKAKPEAEQIGEVNKALHELITYSGNWSTKKGRYFPNDLSQIAKDGEGDCKDFAVSMAAALRALGYQAHVALTNYGIAQGSADLIGQIKTTPMVSLFNHAIVWAKDKSGKTWWIDPTNSYAQGGILPSALLGMNALVLDSHLKSPLLKLPDHNPFPAKTSIQEDIAVDADYSVKVHASMTFNPVAYASIAAVEGLVGTDGMKKVLAAFLNPTATSDGLDYTRTTQGQDVMFDLNLRSGSWISEVLGQSSRIFISPAPYFFLQRQDNSDDVDLGEEGELDSTVNLLGKKVVDSVEPECLIRSPWMDFDRKVTVMNKGTRIEDRFVVKNRFVKKNQIGSAEFKALKSKLEKCIASANVTLFFDPSALTQSQIAFDKVKGPAVAKMTAKDVAKLQEDPTIAHTNYAHQKLYDYYSLQIKKHPDRAADYIHRAHEVHLMGYVGENHYLAEYEKAALNDILAAEKALGGKFNADLATEKIMLMNDLGQNDEAIKEFDLLVQQAPRKWGTEYDGYLLNLTAARNANAEGWIKLAVAGAKSSEQKSVAIEALANLLAQEGKYKDAIAEFKKVLKSPHVTAWNWHNAAAVYFKMKNYDKCIEGERNALKLADISAARNQLSDALFEKAASIADGKAIGTKERLLRKSIKWNPNNVKSLLALAVVDRTEFLANKGQTNLLDEGKDFLERALNADPENTKVVDLLSSYDNLNSRLPASTGPSSGSAAP